MWYAKLKYAIKNLAAGKEMEKRVSCHPVLWESHDTCMKGDKMQ